MTKPPDLASFLTQPPAPDKTLLTPERRAKANAEAESEGAAPRKSEVVEGLTKPEPSLRPLDSQPRLSFAKTKVFQPVLQYVMCVDGEPIPLSDDPRKTLLFPSGNPYSITSLKKEGYAHG